MYTLKNGLTIKEYPDKPNAYIKSDLKGLQVVNSKGIRVFVITEDGTVYGNHFKSLLDLIKAEV